MSKEQKEYPVTPTDPEGPKPDSAQEVGFAADLAGAEIPATKPEEEVKPKGEETPPKKEEKPVWDKDKQHADEKRGFKEREATMTEELTDTKNQLVDMQAKLDTMEAGKAAGDDVDLTEFDDVAKAVKGLMGKIGGMETTFNRTLKEQADEIKSIKGTATAAEAMARKEAGNRALDTTCIPLAKIYGAKYQNAAIDKAQTDYDRLGIINLEPKARNDWVLENLERNFKDARNADTTIDDDAGFDPPNIDSSGGGSQVNTEVTMQEGSLDDVAAQYQQNANTGKKRR